MVEKGGEVAVFDATNSTLTRRNWLLEQLAQYGIQCAFVESICEDDAIIDTNIEQSKLTSPDYVGKVKEDALTDFKAKIAHYVSTYEPLQDGPTPWIKIIDAGRKVILHRISGPILIKVAHLVTQVELDAHYNMAYPARTEHLQYPRQSGWRFESEPKWAILCQLPQCIYARCRSG